MSRAGSGAGMLRSFGSPHRASAEPRWPRPRAAGRTSAHCSDGDPRTARLAELQPQPPPQPPPPLPPEAVLGDGADNEQRARCWARRSVESSRRTPRFVCMRAVPCHAACWVSRLSQTWFVNACDLSTPAVDILSPLPQAKCLKVKLFSEANTGYFYTWKKNPKAYPWRIALRKYDPIVRRHVLFKVGAHASSSNAA